MELLVALPFALRVNRLPWTEFTLASVVPALVAAVPAVGVTLAIIEVADPTALWSLGLSAAAAALAFAGA